MAKGMALNIINIDDSQFTKNSVPNDLYYFAVAYGSRADWVRTQNARIIASFEKLVSEPAPENIGEVDYEYLRTTWVKARRPRYEAALALNIKIADFADNAPVWLEASFHISKLRADQAAKRSKFVFTQVLEVAHK